MPTTTEILAHTTEVAQSAMLLAFGWHVVLAAACVALAAGWRPSERAAGLLLAAPLVSVAVVAAAHGNPFNGIAFAGLSLAQVVVARRSSRTPMKAGPKAAVVIGAMMIAIGWIYPHFLQGHGRAVYLYAAPLGVVPCATLYAVIGLALLGDARSRAWRVVPVAAGLFYGVIGVWQLGVRLDAGLVLGSVILALAGLRQRAERPLHAGHSSTAQAARKMRIG